MLKKNLSDLEAVSVFRLWDYWIYNNNLCYWFDNLWISMKRVLESQNKTHGITNWRSACHILPIRGKSKGNIISVRGADLGNSLILYNHIHVLHTYKIQSSLTSHYLHSWCQTFWASSESIGSRKRLQLVRKTTNGSINKVYIINNDKPLSYAVTNTLQRANYNQFIGYSER